MRHKANAEKRKQVINKKSVNKNQDESRLFVTQLNEQEILFNKMKRVIILDLDNTLIYTTYDAGLKSNQLFKYMNFLFVYERPYAREFIQRCHEIGDVVVFTVSELDYAKQVAEHLNIQPSRIYANEHCIIRENVNRKSVPDHFFDIYDEIIIVDDYPEIWELKIHDRCRFFIPFGFMGDEKDDELKMLMERLSDIKPFFTFPIIK